MLKTNNKLCIRHDYSKHLWCGIAALAAALEIPTTKARQIIRSVSLRKYIKAVTYTEMKHALISQGIKPAFKQYPRDPNACPTLREWLHSKYRKCGETNVVCITGHWLTIRDDTWVCGMNHFARDVDDCPYLQARVRCVIQFNQTSSGS
jgi:hypothetical protein